MGNLTDYNGAIQYPSFTGVTNIYTAEEFTIILFENGTISSFGKNEYAQLGIETSENTNGVIQYTGFTGITDIGGGYRWTFLYNGTQYISFGYNQYGQIGIGNENYLNIKIRYPELIYKTYTESNVTNNLSDYILGYSISGWDSGVTPVLYVNYYNDDNYIEFYFSSSARTSRTDRKGYITSNQYNINTEDSSGLGGSLNIDWDNIYFNGGELDLTYTLGIKNVINGFCGDTHAFVLFPDSTAISAGSNDYGQLGGQYDEEILNYPLFNYDYSAITDIALGDQYSFLLTENEVFNKEILLSLSILISSLKFTSTIPLLLLLVNLSNFIYIMILNKK